MNHCGFQGTHQERCEGSCFLQESEQPKSQQLGEPTSKAGPTSMGSSPGVFSWGTEQFSEVHHGHIPVERVRVGTSCHG